MSVTAFKNRWHRQNGLICAIFMPVCLPINFKAAEQILRFQSFRSAGLYDHSDWCCLLSVAVLCVICSVCVWGGAVWSRSSLSPTQAFYSSSLSYTPSPQGTCFSVVARFDFFPPSFSTAPTDILDVTEREKWVSFWMHTDAICYFICWQ